MANKKGCDTHQVPLLRPHVLRRLRTATTAAKHLPTALTETQPGTRRINRAPRNSPPSGANAATDSHQSTASPLPCVTSPSACLYFPHCLSGTERSGFNPGPRKSRELFLCYSHSTSHLLQRGESKQRQHSGSGTVRGQARRLPHTPYQEDGEKYQLLNRKLISVLPQKYIYIYIYKNKKNTADRHDQYSQAESPQAH